MRWLDYVEHKMAGASGAAACRRCRQETTNGQNKNSGATEESFYPFLGCVENLINSCGELSPNFEYVE